MGSAKRENIVSDDLHSRVMEGKPMFPHAVSVEGKRMICVSGQLAWDKDGNAVGVGDMRAQFRQVGENIKTALGGGRCNVSKISLRQTPMSLT